MTFRKELVEERLNKLTVGVERNVPRFHQDGIGKDFEAKTGAVYEQRRRLEAYLENLATSLDKLEHAIGPVLFPPGDKLTKEEVRAALNVPLADHFSRSCEVLEFLVNRLNALTARVSI